MFGLERRNSEVQEWRRDLKPWGWVSWPRGDSVPGAKAGSKGSLAGGMSRRQQRSKREASEKREGVTEGEERVSIAGRGRGHLGLSSSLWSSGRELTHRAMNGWHRARHTASTT